MLASCAKPPSVPAQAAASVSPEARIQQIPPADPQRYAALKDMKAWRNPYLIVRLDGVGLLDVSNNEQQIVDPDKLPEALAKLPASAWPYGRVVAIQEISANASDQDHATLRKNRALVAGSLESLHVEINWVPSS
ncbi:MAG TPA: hypothetical protein VN950_05745 [Terriglobales bacterium]|nr:hypothetical protein [Terriglobales bacterium]